MENSPALYILAAFPVLLLLSLMAGLRWSAQKAGPTAWLAGAACAAAWFGLTWQVWWVSQARGLLLSLFVLAVLWPALFLYRLADEAGAIRALAGGLENMVADRGLLLVVIAWAFGGALEGLAGFGIPIAVAAPMLVALGVEPLAAVAAVAVGHSWSVTFGDMGVIFQTLIAVVKMDAVELVGASVLLLGVACILCGLGSALILGQARQAPRVVLLGTVMALVQYGLAAAGLYPLGALGAGLAGIGGAALLARKPAGASQAPFPRTLKAALASYGGLALVLTILALPGPLHTVLEGFAWRPVFPAVATRVGFTTPAGPGTVFRFFLHPGAAILLAGLASAAGYRRAKLIEAGAWRKALRGTVKLALPVSIGVTSAVCLSTLMEHSGMTQLLAEGLAALMGPIYPLVSPLVGILGAFATGSNNNSNVLFAPLQKRVAELLGADPRVLIAAQTTGGGLGSMLAPAKVAVGVATVNAAGKEGLVMRRTIPYGLAAGLLIGLITLLLAG